MCRQLERLELLPKGSFDSLKRRGFGVDSVRGVLGDLAPASQKASKNPRLAHLVSSAYRRELVSEGQLASMLGLDRIEVRELIRSEEHTSELQSLMRISYAVFCLKKKNVNNRLN